MNDDQFRRDESTNSGSTRTESGTTPTPNEPVSTDTETFYCVTDVPTSSTVVDAVASVLDTDPIALEPLYYSVDTDALDSLFASRSGGLADDVEVTFSFAGCRVTVNGIGRVLVEEFDGD